MEQQTLWQMDSLSLVVFVIAQDVAIGLQRLLQARRDDQRFSGSVYIGGWLLTKFARFFGVLITLLPVSSSCFGRAQFLHSQFRSATFLGDLLFDLAIQTFQKKKFSLQPAQRVQCLYHPP